MAFDVPEWCETGRGDRPVLLVAPHGGRRPPIDAACPPPQLRVNDLYTADMTRELAQRLGAGFIINHWLDRNQLDLNRISQVRRHAVWFLHLLADAVGEVVRRCGLVEIVFVHGWNTGQLKCDIGIGGSERAGRLHVPDGSRCTVAAPYIDMRIARLRAACAQRGIACTLGARYSGGHRNNLLQLFSARGLEVDHPDARRIGSWATAGRLNAFQLELSIPLRWPGAARTLFVEAMDAAFAAEPDTRARSTACARLPQGGNAQDSALSTRDSPAALQFYDPIADVGMVAGVGRTSGATLAGRLLLFLGGQRVALFTGEEAAHMHAVPPLSCRHERGELRVDFNGTMLLLDDAAVYLDLEAALAASRMIEVDLQARFQPLAGTAAAGAAQFGAADGSLRIGGRAREIRAGAFANAAAFRAVGSSRQTMLAAAFGMERAVLSHASDDPDRCVSVHFNCTETGTLDAARINVTTSGDAYTPATFELSSARHPPLRGEVRSRMSILRPSADGGYLRVTFGVAGFEWGGQRGYGLYEHAQPLHRK